VQKLDSNGKLMIKKSTTPQQTKSIAVLPFVNMSTNEDNEFFSDGITEEIINALTRIPGLRVTSRTSSFFFKNKNLPIHQIGEKLNVSLLLEGSVRLAANKMRITAQLIHAREDFHFWSDTWDRSTDNIFEVQDEVSLLIAEKAREFLGHFEIQDHLVSKQTENLDTYSWYLKGRYHFRKWNPEDARQAVQCYDRALEQDPQHAESMLGKADAISFLATTGHLPQEEYMPLYGELIKQALELNDKLPEGYYQLSHLHYFIYGDFAASLKAAKRSFDLNQNYPEANQQMAFLYLCANQPDLARPYIERSSQIDPLSQEALFFKAYYLYRSERYEEALAVLNQSLADNPFNVPSHSVKAYCLLKLGQYEEALHYFDGIPPEVVVEEDRLGIQTLAYILLKDTAKAAEFVREIEKRAMKPEGFRANSFLLFIYGVQNEKEKAIAWIEQEIIKGSSFLMLHYSDPLIGELRQDPDYLQYQSRIFDLSAFQEPKSVKKDLIRAEEVEGFLTKLYHSLEKDALFLDSNLSLKTLAARLRLHPNQLSWLINEKTGQNFNRFINSYRVKAFQEKALDPNFSHLSLLGIAFESGFNSKTVFNTYFKQEVGMTPRAWVEKSSKL
jgi:adenylate cyclase